MGWSRGHILGRGSSAAVSLATRSHGDVCAVKSAELCQSELLQREQEMLSTLTSPYVVDYRGWDVTKENNKLMYNIFMEYMADGTLTDAIRRHGGRLEEPMIAFYTRQVLQGLEYLHSNGIVHCDIKGSNILISQENEAKIADFGCAKRVEDSGEAEPMRGTPMFMAPEVARGEEQGHPCDIWGLGCTVIEMATGSPPWTRVIDPVSVLYRIAYSGESPEIPSSLSHEAKDFLGKCLKRNPKERGSVAQLLRHPFLDIYNGRTKQIQESNSSSPTSILDECFWNSVGESDTSSSNLNSASFLHSAAERVQELAFVSGEPSWTWDENWITIREDQFDFDFDFEVVVEGNTSLQTQTASTSWSVQVLVKGNNDSFRRTNSLNYMGDYKVSSVITTLKLQEFQIGIVIDNVLPNSSISPSL